MMDLVEKYLIEAKGSSMSMRCNECGHKFKKKIGPHTYEIKCPKCKSYDTEPE
jgi:NAD-dependent SIR2 family protein deacetylase